MTNAFASTEYALWFIGAGAILLVLGLMGPAFRNRDAEAPPEETQTGPEQDPSESETELAQTQAANRKAKLAERTTEIWAKTERGAEEPLNDRPKTVTRVHPP